MKLRPEHFDWLGIIFFPIIGIYAYFIITTNTVPPGWANTLILLTGVGGFVIDGAIIYRFFIRKKR